VFVERFEVFTDTLKRFFDQIQATHPGLPIFLVGHSMGGLIAAKYLLQHQNELTGAILSGPAVKVSESISSMTITLAHLLSKIMPKAGLVQLDASAVSRDPEVVRAYQNDPLVYNGKTTARLGAELLKATLELKEKTSQIKLPLLIMQGSEDQLVDPSGAKEFYANVASQDKTLKLYEGLYHEIFNEPERLQVFADLEHWLEQHLPTE
jgi:alpha-beta hydrolase superfamily lysophospholipase